MLVEQIELLLLSFSDVTNSGLISFSLIIFGIPFTGIVDVVIFRDILKKLKIRSRNKIIDSLEYKKLIARVSQLEQDNKRNCDMPTIDPVVTSDKIKNVLSKYPGVDVYNSEEKDSSADSMLVKRRKK